MKHATTPIGTAAARRRANKLLALTLVLLGLALALPAVVSAVVSAGSGWST